MLSGKYFWQNNIVENDKMFVLDFNNRRQLLGVLFAGLNFLPSHLTEVTHAVF